MLTLDQIKTAHSRVKSGADFPAYVQELILLGVSRYTTFVADGHTLFVAATGEELLSEAKYSPLAVAPSSDTKTFEESLTAHQQGKTDYPTFCQQVADAGIEKWIVDMHAMTCTYFDRSGDKIKTESIPGA